MGIFSGCEEECLQLINSMKGHFPEAWHELSEFLPENERNDLLKAYYLRVTDPDPKVHLPAAEASMKYDIICSTLLKCDDFVEKFLKSSTHLLCPAGIFMHYSYYQ